MYYVLLPKEKRTKNKKKLKKIQKAKAEARKNCWISSLVFGGLAQADDN